MRRYFRVSVTPPTLRDRSGKQAAQKPKSFDNHIWAEPDVQGLLCATFGHVCAYCGEDLSKTRGVVDHYRPEGAVDEDKTHGGYWWLAYTFENYVRSCDTCNNGAHKGTRFPLRHGTHVTFDKKEALATEARAFLHPCEDDIEGALYVDIDKTLLPVCKGSNLDPDLDFRADKFLETFGHFEEHCYFKARHDVYKHVFECLKSGKIDEIRRAASRYSPHSQVARAFLLFRKTPLPTPDEEIAWLTNSFIEKLTYYAVLALESKLQRKAAKRDLEEMQYALAALLVAPPQGSLETVRQILERNELMEDIQPYVEKLKAIRANKKVMDPDPSSSKNI